VDTKGKKTARENNVYKWMADTILELPKVTLLLPQTTKDGDRTINGAPKALRITPRA